MGVGVSGHGLEEWRSPGAPVGPGKGMEGTGTVHRPRTAAPSAGGGAPVSGAGR